MKHEAENLTVKESLDIISAMIREAKGNVRRNNFFFLFWGWVVVAANIGMYSLDRLGYDHPYAVWLITIPAWLVTLYKIYTLKKSDRVTTHFDRVAGALWITYGITVFILVFFGFKLNFQLNPVILLMSAIPTIVSGMILNFRPLIIGGATFWISGVACFLVSFQEQPLVGALSIVFGFLIPGYMLKSRKE